MSGYIVTPLLASSHERLKAVIRRQHELEPLVATLGLVKLATLALGGDVGPVQERATGLLD